MDASSPPQAPQLARHAASAAWWLALSLLSPGCTTTKPPPERDREPGWSDAVRPTDELEEKRRTRSFEDPAKDLEGRLSAVRHGSKVQWELSLSHAPSGPLVLDLYRGVSCTNLSSTRRAGRSTTSEGSLPLAESLVEVEADETGQATASGILAVETEPEEDDGSELDDEAALEAGDAAGQEIDDDGELGPEAQPSPPSVLGAVIVRSADDPPMRAGATIAPSGYGCFDLPLPAL